MKKTFRLTVLLIALLNFSLAQWGTGLFINGVELSQAQVMELAYVGIYLPVGYYWFDPVTGQFGLESSSTLSTPQDTYGSQFTDYGSSMVDGDFSGFISPDGSVTCGPDGGCIFSE